MRIATIVVTVLALAGTARAYDADSLTADAWKLEEAGKYKDAVARFDKAILLAPSSANAHDGRGLARANLGDIDGAFADFATALQLDPGNAWTLANRGIVETFLGRDADAKRDLDAATPKLGDADRAQLATLIAQVLATRPPPAGLTAKAYFDGGVARYKQNQMPQAFAWFLEAAKLGDARAQLQVGWHYDAGAGVPRDKQLALTWWAMAASQGDEIAEADLGNVYMGDQGIPADFARARRWYARAAQKGNAKATQQLATLDRRHLGVARGGGAAWMSSVVGGNAAPSSDDGWLKKHEEDQKEQARKDDDQKEKDRQDQARKDWNQNEEDTQQYYQDREAENRAAELREQAGYAQQEAENRAAEARQAAERAQQEREEAEARAREEEERARNSGQ